MKRYFATAVAMLAAIPALAHHPLGGLPTETSTNGVRSGAGHPVLGFDHMFFAMAVGIAALFAAKRFATPAASIGAIAIAIRWVVEKRSGATGSMSMNARQAGATIAGVGIVLSRKSIERPFLAMIAR